MSVTVRDPIATVLAPITRNVERAVREELIGLVAELGIPAGVSADVRCRVGDTDGDLVRLAVAGHRCRFPERLLAEVLAAVDGRPTGSGLDPLLPIAKPDGATEGSGPEAAQLDRLVKFIALLCRAAISEQPGLLLPDAVAGLCLDAISSEA